MAVCTYTVCVSICATIIILNISRHVTGAPDSYINVTSLFNKLLTKSYYDGRIRPKFGDSAVNVTIGFWVIAIDDVDLTNMDYTIEFYLRQKWHDERLKHTHEREIVVEPQLHPKLWLPDTYIVNSKFSKFHTVTFMNRNIKIDPDGRVNYNVRLSVRASCPVDLRSFPWDEQRCPLTLESYGYNDKHVNFYWEANANDGGKFATNVKDMAQYTLVGVKLMRNETQYAVGTWITLTATFRFKRVNGFYLLQTIGPAVIIVLISWISFIIQLDQHPARVGLGITAVLTMAAIQSFINSSLPKVSYVKIIDIYSITCYLFVYMSLVEYAVVLVVVERIKKENMLKAKREEIKESERRTTGVAEEHLSLFGTLWRRIGTRLKEPVFFFDNKTEYAARRIDKFSRMFFPFCFIVFNALFWVYVKYVVNTQGQDLDL